jgi:hypothetical protein
MKRTISKILGVALAIALLVSMVIGVIPVSANVSTPSVSLSASTISVASNYTVTFSVVTALTTGVASTDNIVITLPAGTNATAAAISKVQVGSGGGIGTNANPLVNVTAQTTFPANTTVAQTLTIALTNAAFADNIGATATVQVILTGVVNPSTAGTTYTLTVATSKETTAVTSAAYTLTNPTPNDIAGLVQGYNAAGVLLQSWSGADVIATAIGYAGVTKVVVSDGTYDIDSDIQPLAGQTIVSVNGGGTTIIKLGVGATNTNKEVKLTNAGVTFGGVGTGFTIINTSTFTGATNVVVTSAGTAAATVLQNCIVSTVVAGIPAITVTGGNTNAVSVIGCTISTNAKASTNANGIVVATSTIAAPINIKSNVFFLDGTDNAISAGATTAGLTVDSNILNASPAGSGIGFVTAGASAGVTISNNTFNSLAVGISVTNAGANLTIAGSNKFTTCGTAASTTDGAISMTAGPGAVVTINNNTFSGNVGYSIYVNDAGAAGNMSATGNVFTGNIKGVKVSTTGGALNADLNYWGAAAGPNTTGAEKVVTIPTTVTVTPILASQSTASQTGASPTLNAQASAGIIVSGVSAGNITAISFATNPTTVAPPYATASYFDVYTSAISGTTVNIQFFTSTINTGTIVYFFSPLLSQWVKCDTTAVSGNGSYVLVTLDATPFTLTNPMTTPNTGDLNGTIFAVVNGPIPTPPTTYINLVTPTTGSTINVLTNIPFAWSPVTGATAYTFVLSPNADLSGTLVVKSTTSTVYTYTGTLVPGPYYWQVTASVGSTDVKSLPGVFIAQAPVTPPATTITTVINTTVVTTQPITTTSTVVTTTQTVIQNTTTQTTITNTSTSTQVTPSWIWGIIGIGAILIIVVIVLIVRTRRTV